MCKWFPLDLKICTTLNTQDILNIYHWNFLVGHVLVGVAPCRRCAVATSLPQIVQHLKKSQNNSLKICELILIGMLPLFWMRVTNYHLMKIWMHIWWKTNPNLIYKLLPLKTTIDILIIISHILELQHSKFALWVITSNLQTSIWLDLSWKI